MMPDSQTDVDARRERIIRRIVNLLRRAERDDGPEADTARMFARRLQDAHGLEISLELESTRRAPIDSLVVESEAEPIWWRTILASHLAMAFECQSLTTRSVTGEKWLIWLTGPPAKLRRCSIQYEWLVGQVVAVSNLVCLYSGCTDSEWEEGICCGAMQNLLGRLGENAPNSPVDLQVKVIEHNDQALVRTSVPVHVEIHPEGGPETLLGFPTMIIDPDPKAMERGYQAARSYEPRPPAVCYGPIEDLALDRETTRLLKEAEFDRVCDLMRLRSSQLKKIPGILQTHRIEIFGALRRYRIEPRQDW